MFKIFDEICLNTDEKIILKTRPSVKALIITWLAIPSFLFVTLFLPFLGTLIKTLVSESVKQSINIQGVSPFAYAWQSVFGDLLGIVKFLIFFPITLLVTVWVVLCLILTYRHFKYFVVITDSRLLGKSKNKEVVVSLKTIKNVYCEQSIWGKFLNYGNVIVNTSKNTFEFKSISSPKKIKDFLMKYASDYSSTSR